MKLKLSISEIDKINEIALNDYLILKGFKKDLPILRLCHYGGISGKVSHITFLQDENPDYGSDNIECKWLTKLSS